MFVGCNKVEIDAPNDLSNEITAFAPSLRVGDQGVFIPVPEKLKWQIDSKLSVFRGKNANEQFELSKGDGQNKATFNLVESVSTDAEELSSNIAICPYSLDYKLSEMEDSFEIQGVTIPAEQKGEQLPMWAISDKSSYTFNIPCAIVEVNLSDFDKCDGVLIRALGDESLAGSCNLVINKDGSSSLNVISGSSSVSSKEQISSKVYKAKVLPGTFTKGIYVEVLGSTEKSSKFFDLSEFQAGKLYHLNGLIPGEYFNLNTFEEHGPQENNEIWVKTMNDKFPKSINGYVLKRDADSDWWKYETEDEHEITKLADKLFFSDKLLTDIKLPSSIIEIGESVFQDCVNLRNIVLPEGLLTIRGYSFYQCSSLKSIEIPSTVTSISNDEFSYDTFEEFKFLPSPETFQGDVFVVDNTNNTALILPHAWKYESGDRQVDPVANTWMGLTWKSITFIGEDDHLETGPQENNEIWVKTTNNICPKSIDGYIVKRDADSDWWKYETKDGQNITKLSDYLMNKHDRLTEIKLPSSITEIGKFVFQDCVNLRNIVLPEGLLTIGGYSLYNCISLKSIEIPSTVTSIGGYEFSYDTFDEFKFLPSPETYPYDVYVENTENTALILPHAWKYESGDRQVDPVANTWMGLTWKSITFIGEDDHLETGPQENNEIWVKTTNNTCPKSIDGYFIKRDADSDWWKYETKDGHEITILVDELFYNDKLLTEIKLPSSIIEIKGSVFQFCDNLRNIVLPEGLLTIGGYSLYKCSSLKSIEIPSTVTSMGNYVFSYDTFDEFKFLPSPETYPYDVYVENTENTALILPHAWKYESDYRQVDPVANTWMGATWKSITFIGEDDCFESGPQENNELWLRTMNNRAPKPIDGYIVKRDVDSDWWKYETQDGHNLTEISRCMFEIDSDVIAVKAPSTVTHICDSAFLFAKNLEEVGLPVGLKSIGQEAFRSCTSLREISLPEGLEHIGCDAFYFCQSLNAITIPSTIKNFSLAIFCHTGLQTLTINVQPQNVDGVSRGLNFDAGVCPDLVLPHAWKYESGSRQANPVDNTWMDMKWNSITFTGEDSSVESGSSVANFKY